MPQKKSRHKYIGAPATLRQEKGAGCKTPRCSRPLFFHRSTVSFFERHVGIGLFPMLPYKTGDTGKGGRIRQRLHSLIEIQLSRRVSKGKNHQEYSDQLGSQQGKIHHAVHAERSDKGDKHHAGA